MAGKVMLAVGRRPQFLVTGATPQGCLSVLTMWGLASSAKNDPQGKAKAAKSCTT